MIDSACPSKSSPRESASPGGTRPGGRTDVTDVSFQSRDLLADRGLRITELECCRPNVPSSATARSAARCRTSTPSQRSCSGLSIALTPPIVAVRGTCACPRRRWRQARRRASPQRPLRSARSRSYRAPSRRLTRVRDAPGAVGSLRARGDGQSARLHAREHPSHLSLPLELGQPVPMHFACVDTSRGARRLLGSRRLPSMVAAAQPATPQRIAMLAIRQPRWWRRPASLSTGCSDQRRALASLASRASPRGLMRVRRPLLPAVLSSRRCRSAPTAYAPVLRRVRLRALRELCHGCPAGRRSVRPPCR